jgi:hypothetical protein
VTVTGSEEVRKIKIICSIPKEQNFFVFRPFDITTVVITAPIFAEKEGYRNENILSCSMIPIKPIELK